MQSVVNFWFVCISKALKVSYYLRFKVFFFTRERLSIIKILSISSFLDYDYKKFPQDFTSRHANWVFSIVYQI